MRRTGGRESDRPRALSSGRGRAIALPGAAVAIEIAAPIPSQRRGSIRIPGKVGRAYRAGENLTLEGATVGTLTWNEYLDAHDDRSRIPAK